MDWKLSVAGKRCGYQIRPETVTVGHPLIVDPPPEGVLCQAPASWEAHLSQGPKDDPREWSPRDFIVYRCGRHHELDLAEEKYWDKLLKAKMVVFPYIPLQTPQIPLGPNQTLKPEHMVPYLGPIIIRHLP